MTATISPVLDGAPSLFSVAFDLATVGYSVHEHIAIGTAESYAAAGPREPDGRWEVKESDRADFTTRLVVHRPTDPARSNGTLIVEWLNVTGGVDIPALWMPTHRHLVRDGYSWVGVTAQRVGIEGGGVMPGMGLRDADPARYETLDHPGDAYAYDIFTQVVRAARDLVSGQYAIPIERVLATGASQSAMYVLQRAFDALDRWVRDGTPPPSAARLAVDGEGALGVDDAGIARGGVRTPWVDAPVAVLSGLGQPGGSAEHMDSSRGATNA